MVAPRFWNKVFFFLKEGENVDEEDQLQRLEERGGELEEVSVSGSARQPGDHMLRLPVSCAG